MSSVHPLRAALLLGAAALALGACSHPQAVAPAARPPLAKIDLHEQVAPRERIWDGTVEAVHQATLSAQTAGRVLELPFDVNDYVPQGAVVVRFTAVEQGAAVNAAQAQVRSAQAAYTNAEAQDRRIAAVYARKLVSQTQMDQTRAQRDAAKAALDAAQANLRQAAQSADYTVVRAPYSGILTKRFVQVGEAVQPGQPLIAGLSLDQLRVEAQVPQSDVNVIRKFSRAWVLYDGGSKRVEAAKVIVFPYADATTHTFTVRLELPTAKTGLNPGEVVKVAFMIGSRPRLLLPDSVIVRRGEIVGVYVIRGDAVMLRQVRLGYRFGNDYEVLAGLAPGEQVAADPGAAMKWLIAQHAEGAAAHD